MRERIPLSRMRVSIISEQYGKKKERAQTKVGYKCLPSSDFCFLNCALAFLLEMLDGLKTIFLNLVQTEENNTSATSLPYTNAFLPLPKEREMAHLTDRAANTRLAILKGVKD